MSTPIVFIHGAWMPPECWDDFRTPFREAGYETHAPAWPLVSSDVGRMRSETPPEFGRLSVGAIVEHYASIVAAMPSPPVLIGHSFGGLFTQLLLDRGYGAAGVALDPAPIRGVIPTPSAFRAALPVVARVNGWNRPYLLSREAFETTFANTAPPVVQQEAYDRYVIPAPGRIFYQAASSVGTGIIPTRRTKPLVIMQGLEDRTVTPAMGRTAAKIQSRSNAETDFVEFAGRSHFLLAEPGWEEVAEAALEFVRRVAP
jgi:pimeloyl-ACP methyl ester carboxylesterase